MELSKLPEEVWRGRDMVPALMATNAAEHFSSSFRTAKGSCLLFDRCSSTRPRLTRLTQTESLQMHFWPPSS